MSCSVSGAIEFVALASLLLLLVAVVDVLSIFVAFEKRSTNQSGGFVRFRFVKRCRKAFNVRRSVEGFECFIWSCKQSKEKKSKF